MLVEKLPPPLEWDQHDTPTRIRCFWLLGLWSILRKQLAWPTSWEDVAIELVPIIIDVALWGPLWAGAKVRCLCNNIAVVFAVNKGTAKDPQIRRLLHILAFWCAMFNVTLVAQRVPGSKNVSADALSCNKYTLFCVLNPQADPVPVGVPVCLQEITLNQFLR